MRGLTKQFAIAAFAIVTMPALIFLGEHLPLKAQNDACYMVNSRGQRVSLGKLCGKSTQTVSNKGYHLARIKRRDGGTPVIEVTLNCNRTF